MQKATVSLDKYEVKLSGSVTALRNSRSLTEIASVFTCWRAEPAVLALIEKTSCLKVSVSRVLDPAGKALANQSIHIGLRYRAGGDDAAALPDDTTAGSATVADVINKLVATSGVSEEEAASIKLHNGSTVLGREDKLLPLFANAEPVLVLKMTTTLPVGAASRVFGECAIA